MINLLPHDEKRKLRTMYRLRVLAVSLCFLLAFEVFVVVMFIPSFYTVSLTQKELERNLAEKKAGVPKDVEEIQKEVADLKSEIDLLGGESDVAPTTLVGMLVRAKNNGISLWGFFFDRDTHSLQVRGYATTRDALTLFRKNLRETKGIESADIPPNVLLHETDIDFTMKIILKN